MSALTPTITIGSAANQHGTRRTDPSPSPSPFISWSLHLRQLEPANRNSGRAERPVVKGRSHQRTVTSQRCQLVEIQQPAYPATHEKLHSDGRRPYLGDERAIDATPRAHAAEVEEDHGTRTMLDRATGERTG